MRSSRHFRRPGEVAITVDGRVVHGFPGESLATLLLASGLDVFRIGVEGKPRGLYCNMGSCSECMVDLVLEDGRRRPMRACLVTISDAMVVERRAGADG
jgi:sarcosine oxidase subunit alpha